MLLQVKSGSIFDNILVTDSLDEALKFGEETWGKIKDEEKAAFDKIKEVCDYCCHLGRSLHLCIIACVGDAADAAYVLLSLLYSTCVICVGRL